jgi:hypothetical protein
MKTTLKAGLLIAALGFIGGVANASPFCVPPSGPLAYCEEIFTQSVPLTHVPWNENLIFPGFDDMGGSRTLLGIEITQTITFNGVLDFLNTLWNNGCTGNTYPSGGCADPQPTDPPDGGQLIVSAGATVPLTLSGPIGPNIVTTASVSTSNQHIEPKHDVLTAFAFLCPSPVVHGSNVNEGGCFGPGVFIFAVATDGKLTVTGLGDTESSGVVAVDSLYWGSWMQPSNPTVTLNASTTFGSCFRDANDGVFVNCGGNASGEVSVKYIWQGESVVVPEPMTIALTGSALIALGLISRRRLSKR